MRAIPAIVAVAMPVVTACGFGGPAPGGLPAPSRGGSGTYLATSFDTTWYVTNRARRDGEFTRDPGDSLEFGIVVTRFRERAGPGSDGPLREGFDTERVRRIALEREEFVRLLGERSQATADSGAILYVHGYAVGFDLAIKQAAEIAHRGSYRGPMIAFAWPAHGTVITWPSPSAIVSRAYREDSASAVASRQAFRETLSAIRRAVQPRAMTVVGHSLGAQLLAEAVAVPSGVRDAMVRNPFRAIVLFAPDIEVARMRDVLAPAILPLAHRKMVYASDDDLMMDLSRMLNGSDRAGTASRARDLAAVGLEVVDVTRGQRAGGTLRQFFAPGHAMRFASAALYDFFGVVRGAPPGCRAALPLAVTADSGVWRVSDATVPPRAASAEEIAAGCAGPDLSGADRSTHARQTGRRRM